MTIRQDDRGNYIVSLPVPNEEGETVWTEFMIAGPDRIARAAENSTVEALLLYHILDRVEKLLTLTEESFGESHAPAEAVSETEPEGRRKRA